MQSGYVVGGRRVYLKLERRITAVFQQRVRVLHHSGCIEQFYAIPFGIPDHRV